MDIFTTVANITGAPVPTDRAIDGVDQTEFLLGRQAKSNREGVLVYVNGDLHAVKWRDWKLHFWWQVEPQSGKDVWGSVKLEVLISSICSQTRKRKLMSAQRTVGSSCLFPA